MPDLLTRVTAAQARDAADVLRIRAEQVGRLNENDRAGQWKARARLRTSRAEALRRVAEWIEREAMK